MDFICPEPEYFDAYLSACRVAYDRHETEWLPVLPEQFSKWKNGAQQMYQALANGHDLPAGVPKTLTYWCVEGGHFLGEVQLRPCLTKQEARKIGHIGYAVSPLFRGRGYGTLLLQFAVKSLETPAIYLVCHSENAVSNHLCQKLGLQLCEQRETETLYLLDKEQTKGNISKCKGETT